MGMKVRTLAGVAAVVALSGCSKPDPLVPGDLAGTWGGGTQQGYRTVTFTHGSMKSDQVSFDGTFPVEYHPENSGQKVRVVVQFPDGKRGELHYTVRLPVGEIEDAFGTLRKKPDAATNP